MAHYGGLASPVYLNDVITHDKLFLIQANIIKEISQKPCVIVGRCADDILKDYCKSFNVFIQADMSFRTERISKLYDLSAHSAETLIKKTDKGRKNYYDFYAHSAWGAASSYDLTISSSTFGMDKTVDVISMCAEKFF
jgi:cytidylate kinase